MSCSWSSQDGQTPKTLIHPHLAGHDFVHLSVSQQPTREGTSCVNQVDNRLFESEKTLEVVVSCANYIIRTNDGVDDAPITQYDSKVVPGFTFESYAHRLKTHFQCSDAAIILGMIYVTKVVDSMSISLTQRNVHRVYLVCLLIACKFIEDHFYTNTYYAKSGGVSLDEMNRLEVQTLKQLDWNFCVSRGCYFDFIRSVLGSCGNPRAVISQLPPRELLWQPQMLAHGSIPVPTAVDYSRFGQDSPNAKTVAECSESTTAPGSESSTQQFPAAPRVSYRSSTQVWQMNSLWSGSANWHNIQS